MHIFIVYCGSFICILCILLNERSNSVNIVSVLIINSWRLLNAHLKTAKFWLLTKTSEQFWSIWLHDISSFVSDVSFCNSKMRSLLSALYDKSSDWSELEFSIWVMLLILLWDALMFRRDDWNIGCASSIRLYDMLMLCMMLGNGPILVSLFWHRLSSLIGWSVGNVGNLHSPTLRLCLFRKN